MDLCVFNKFYHCALRCVHKSAATVKFYFSKNQKTSIKPLCEAMMASGAKWACDGLGEWYLVDCHHPKKNAAIHELIEYYALMPEFGVKSPKEKMIVANSLAALYEIGFFLPMKSLYQRKKHHAGNNNPPHIFGCDDAENAADQNRKENGINTYCPDCPFNCLMRN